MEKSFAITGGRRAVNTRLLTSSFPERPGGFSCEKNAFDFRFTQNFSKVVWSCIFNRRICSTRNLAAGKYVPKGYVMAKKKFASFRNCRFSVRRIIGIKQGFSKNCRQHLPEPVLRMHVEKSGFATFW